MQLLVQPQDLADVPWRETICDFYLPVCHSRLWRCEISFKYIFTSAEPFAQVKSCFQCGTSSHQIRTEKKKLMKFSVEPRMKFDLLVLWLSCLCDTCLTATLLEYNSYTINSPFKVYNSVLLIYCEILQLLTLISEHSHYPIKKPYTH